MTASRRNSDWEDLPTMFVTPAQPAVPAGVTVDLSPAPGLDLLRRTETLRRVAEEAAVAGARVWVGSLVIPPESARRVHDTVLAIAGDTGRPTDTRAAALELAKRVEAATGLRPEEAVYELVRSTGVMRELMSIALEQGLKCPLAVTPDARDRGRTLLLTTGGVDQRGLAAVVEVFPSVFPQEFASAYEAWHDLHMPPGEDGYDDSVEWDSRAFGVRVGLEAVGQLLGKTGVETIVCDVCGCGDPLHFAIAWRDPATGESSFMALASYAFEDDRIFGSLVCGRDLIEQAWHFSSLGAITEGEWDEMTRDGRLPYGVFARLRGRA